MADDVNGTDPLYEGSVLPITIEDVLPDLLVVCLNHGAKMYRGVLMDASKRDMPPGVNFSMARLRKSCEVAKKARAGSCVEVDVSDSPPELSALVNRHTYTLDSMAVGPRLLSPPRVNLSRPLRDKNIRNMRLRPRQVLCSKCKEGIHDTKVQNQTTTRDKQAKPPDATTELNPPPHSRHDTTKHRSVPPEEPCRKSRRLAGETVSKSGPVIKISFGGPEGHGTVVEIPRKSLISNIPQASDSEEGRVSPSYNRTCNDRSEQHSRRLRKSQKRKGRDSETDQESVCSESKSNKLPQNVRRKKGKRSKHKRKHRHRNSKQESPENKARSEGDESMKENDRVRTTVVLEDGAESVVDGMLMYAGDDDDSDSLGKYPEDMEPGRDGIVVLSPRHNFLLEHSHLKLGTPNKHSDTNTETSQDLDLDFPKDFFSSKHELDGSDSENNLSDAQYGVSSDLDQENLDGDFTAEFGSGVEDDALAPTTQPLMIRIQNRRVNKVLLEDGRAIQKGDVIWGKIHGFPWWPGRVLSLNESLKDSGIIINQTAHISWFASSTMSHMACAELYPFLEDFKLRYNKRKKGSYKTAIKQATLVAHTVAAQLGSVTPEVPDLEINIVDS